MKHYAHYLDVTDWYNLNVACRCVQEAFPFGYGCFLVGSALKSREFRDVDIRCILPDQEFQRLFDFLPDPCDEEFDPRRRLWRLTCIALSEWLQARTDLPIDFQIQSETEANSLFGSKAEHPRNAVGMIV